MAGAVTRAEFDEVKDEVAGEKLVTRHILEQTRRNGDDLAALKTRLGRVEQKVDVVDARVVSLDGRVAGLDGRVTSLDGRVGGLEGKLDRLDQKVDGLIRDLPRIVGDTMRDVLSERPRKGKAPRKT